MIAKIRNISNNGIFKHVKFEYFAIKNAEDWSYRVVMEKINVESNIYFISIE